MIRSWAARETLPAGTRGAAPDVGRAGALNAGVRAGPRARAHPVRQRPRSRAGVRRRATCGVTRGTRWPWSGRATTSCRTRPSPVATETPRPTVPEGRAGAAPERAWRLWGWQRLRHLGHGPEHRPYDERPGATGGRTSSCGFRLHSAGIPVLVAPELTTERRIDYDHPFAHRARPARGAARRRFREIHGPLAEPAAVVTLAGIGAGHG
ncbi:hypothetical protein QJS66_07585 [Kocuria rhizophila]|nr:hypothetical protein QJS66_07585 [Kocuria rhizophila]